MPSAFTIVKILASFPDFHQMPVIANLLKEECIYFVTNPLVKLTIITTPFSRPHAANVPL